MSREMNNPRALGLTPSGLFMGLSSTLIYTSELILCSTICVPSATRHTEALLYWPSDSEVNTVGWGLRFSRNDRTAEVIKLFFIWLTKRKEKI